MSGMLEDIRTRAAAATPGPWFWRGNMDNDDPRLMSRGLDVLGHVRRERTADDPAAKGYAEFLRDARIWDAGIRKDDGSRGDYRRYTAAEIADRIRADYLKDAWDQTRTDDRLAFCDQDTHFYREARELAIFEVARAQGLPDDTPRDHPKVYRADIVGIRDPNAEFIEHSRADIDFLLAEVDRLSALLGDMAGQHS